jgi:hypothetical protein
MPQESQPLDISVQQPGVFKTGTSLAAAGRYIDTNKVRFKNGRPEKWAGWMKLVTAAINGVARGCLGWVDSGGVTLLCVGTAFKLYSGYDMLTDITPLRAVGGSGSLGNNPFTTTNLSTSVQVALTAHGLAVGQHVHFAGATAFNNVTLNGEYVVATIVDANDFTVTANTTANASSSGGGAGVTYQIELAPGLQDTAFGLGWGTGTFGSGTWGTPRSSGGVTLDLRTWFISKYGDELMICPSGDTIFLWNEPNSDPRPLPLAGAPTTCRAMFVTAERYVVALGTTSPMLMQWPDVDTLSWVADITNTANARKLQWGNKLIAGTITGDTVNVFWSDTAIYLMQYTGGQFIYATPVLAKNAGLIGPCAFADTPAGLLWMSSQDFHIYVGGQVTFVQNRLDVRDWVLRNLDASRTTKIVAGYDQLNNAVIWSMCYSGDSEPGHYIEVSLDDWSWNVGTWDSGGNRTAIANFGYPSAPFLMVGDDAGGGNGFVYTHNIGLDADGVAMPWHITRGIIGLDEGDLDVEIEFYEPDYERQKGTVTLEVRALERPMVDWFLQDEFYSIPQGTVLLHLAPVIGARYAQFIESGNSLGGDWRCGVSKIWVAPGGTAEA